MKKLTILTVALLLTALVQLTAPPVQAEVSIPDDNLAVAIREALGLPTDAVITADAMLDLTELDAATKEIADLTGLEHAVNLIWLNLGGTGVSDVSPLAALTQLTELSLEYTAVSDVSPLANLTQLTGLYIFDTAVSDVSPLANLTQLTRLNLNNTAVSDVSPLAALTQLTYLSLTGCPLSYASIHTHIPAMQAKGIEVAFDNVADVNGDGVVNIQDLVLVSGQLGKTGENSADVNGDGVVNILDLVFVAGAFH